MPISDFTPLRQLRRFYSALLGVHENLEKMPAAMNGTEQAIRELHAALPSERELGALQNQLAALEARLHARFDACGANAIEDAAGNRAGSASRTIELDYPFVPKARWGHDSGRPSHPQLTQIIRADDALISEAVDTMVLCREELRRIPVDYVGPEEPYWVNGWLPGWDGAALYAFTASRKPATYLEVGSGNSTKFVRRAIRDLGLRTRIVSIDPHPRAEIDALCDEVIRHPVEDTDLAIFDRLEAGDICFIDNSHRSFQNSDVTVSFLEILPRLKPGILIGFHDIYLPVDYPAEWQDRYYNEQYLLACFLLGGHRGTRIYLPAVDVLARPEFAERINAIWDVPDFDRVELQGVAFWLLTV